MGDGRIFLQIFRASLFNDDLSNVRSPVYVVPPQRYEKCVRLYLVAVGT